MKNQKLIFIFIVGILISCSPKIYEPKLAHSAWVSENIAPVSVMDLQTGRTMYINTCQACHALHNPNEFARNDWERIYAVMSVKAHLEDSTTKQKIYQYIMAGANDVKLED